MSNTTNAKPRIESLRKIDEQLSMLRAYALSDADRCASKGTAMDDALECEYQSIARRIAEARASLHKARRTLEQVESMESCLAHIDGAA